MSGYFTRTYELWRQTTTTGPYGEVTKEWNKQADVSGRCYKKSISGGYASASYYGELNWTFACPADTDIQNADQIRFDGRTLDVTAIGVTSRGGRIEALCKEVQL